MENWKFALSSILSHKMRSFLTMLGIIIGVASVVMIMALGQGLKKGISDQVNKEQKNLNVYYKTKAEQEAEKNPYYQVDASDSSAKAPDIQEAWVEKIAQDTKGVSGYYITNSKTATVSYRKKSSKNVNITGINRTYLSIKKFKIIAGRSFTSNDYDKFGRIIMLDANLAKKLFGDNETALNKVITLSNKSYLVVGVYEDPNAGTATYGTTSGGNAIMTNTQVANEFGVKENDQIYFHINDVSQANKIGKETGAALTKISGAKDGLYENYNMDNIVKQANQMASMYTIAFGVIAGISLLVGGIGVMNIMLVSVTERTREIGLRKALGATRIKILNQFLIESIVLTILGGLIGLGIAYMGVTAITPALKAQHIVPAISLQVILISIAFSAFVGIVFGLLPANKASKLNPIDALRYE
ncbi:ABC transporter permease [Streptococcus mutans]|uniref:ABC transporter permease n=1 Tax=Streptococcus mutans TaxID=1309 RepID=UPI0002D3FFDA|nr:ABC transporter permease [Streptococcus mutans]